MGLGVEVHSTPWRGGFAAARTLPALAQQLRETITPALPEGVLRRRLHVGVGEHGVLVHWHPGEEGMVVDLLADGRVHVSVKTSTVGPGYHAFVVDLLDRMAVDMQLQWQWDAEDSGDDTGYAQNRDFPALQQAMSDWLQAMAVQLLSLDDVSGLQVNMATQLRPEIGDAVATPLGPRQRELFEQIAQAAAIDPAWARQFFAWWDQGFSAPFWDGCASTIAWSDLAWVTPRDEHERALLRSVLDMLEHARAQEPGTAFPQDAADEIEALLAPGSQVTVPVRDGIGYRRAEATFQLFAGWTLRVGGHFRTTALNESEHDGTDDDATDAMQLDDGIRAIHVSSMSVNDRDGAPMPAADLHAAVSEEADQEWRNGAVFGSARWEREADSKHLYAALAVDGRLLLLTITDALDGDPDWAEAVARSALHSPQDAAQGS